MFWFDMYTMLKKERRESWSNDSLQGSNIVLNVKLLSVDSGSMQIIYKLYAYLTCKSLAIFLHCLPHTWFEAPGGNPGGNFQSTSIYLISSYSATLQGVQTTRLGLCPRGVGKWAGEKGGTTRDNYCIIEDKMLLSAECWAVGWKQLCEVSKRPISAQCKCELSGRWTCHSKIMQSLPERDLKS